MSARHTLLALLAEGPAHGYLLRKRLSTKLGPAWQINTGSISRSLSRLEQEGLIRTVNGESNSQGRKRVFALTEEGAVELARWFEADSAGVRVDNPEFLAKVNLGGPERSEESERHITKYEAECLSRLTEMRARRESVGIFPVVTGERLLKRCAISGEIFDVEGKLQLALLVRDARTMLQEYGAQWDASSARNIAETVRERERAREEILQRMAQSHLDVLPGNENA